MMFNVVRRLIPISVLVTLLLTAWPVLAADNPGATTRPTTTRAATTTSAPASMPTSAPVEGKIGGVDQEQWYLWMTVGLLSLGGFLTFMAAIGALTARASVAKAWQHGGRVAAQKRLQTTIKTQRGVFGIGLGFGLFCFLMGSSAQGPASTLGLWGGPFLGGLGLIVYVFGRSRTRPLEEGGLPTEMLIKAASGGESLGRRLRLVMLGLLLAGAFFVPHMTWKPGEKAALEYPDFSYVSASQAPWQAKVAYVYPLAAGALVALLGLLLERRIRGVLLLGLFAAAAIFLACGGPDAGWPAAKAAVALPKDFLAPVRGLPLGLLLGIAGVVLLYVATRSRHFRPHYGLLYLMALAGGAWALVPQFWVTDLTGQKMPGLYFFELFKAQADPAAKASSGMALGALGGMALASVLALVNVWPLKGGSGSKLANASFKLCILAIILAVGANMYAYFTGPGRGLATGDLAVLLVNQGKLWLCVVGLGLLGPVGLVDVIIGSAKNAPVSAEAAAEQTEVVVVSEGGPGLPASVEFDFQTLIGFCIFLAGGLFGINNPAFEGSLWFWWLLLAMAAFAVFYWAQDSLRAIAHTPTGWNILKLIIGLGIYAFCAFMIYVW